MTFQALSEEDRRQWLDAMDGREPVYSPGAGPPSVGSFNSNFILILNKSIKKFCIYINDFILKTIFC